MSAVETRPSAGRASRSARTGALGLDEAKLAVPEARTGSVPRTALVNRLRAAGSAVVTLGAPAGYGKTNVLAQWAGRDERPVAWLSIADDDDDPVSLCRSVAAALGRVASIDPAIFDSLGSRRRSAASALRALTSALSSFEQPLVLVLDDVHLLRSRECGRTVAALAERFPDGSTLVLAGRALPRIPSARLRVQGRLLEVGPAELALNKREIDLLVRRLDVELGAPELDELAERTEGWAAGVYLAAIPLKDAPGAEARTSEADRFLADYFDFEYLSALSAKDVSFLTRTSVLDSMCGSLCDAVLEAEGSARKLGSLSSSSLFVVPLDRPGGWFRYHHQFRSFLRAELERREPDLVAVLNWRAAAWCQANGAPEAAISYAHAAGDVDLLARLVMPRVLPAWYAGHDTAVETWLGWFDDTPGLERYPALALLGAWVHALRGRTAKAERWFDVAAGSEVDEAPPDGSASLRPWFALVRAAMCPDGAEQMRADAELALRELGPASRWRPTALFLRGAAQLLLGENERAEASMADAAEAAGSVRATPTQIAALAEWSLLAANRGDEARAEPLALQARALVDEHRLGGYARSAIAYAVSARRGLRTGDLELARADLENARALRPLLTHALPWYSVHASLELARVELALLDVPGARAWLSGAGEILRRRPRLGVLGVQLAELEVEAERVAEVQDERVSTLTAAELRLLPLLATHLSFREIGEHLCVSRNTVKTQAISVYRKLGVSSRSEAIERAVDLGLVGSAPVISVDFIRTG